jgi:hypothetical protein
MLDQALRGIGSNLSPPGVVRLADASAGRVDPIVQKPLVFVVVVLQFGNPDLDDPADRAVDEVGVEILDKHDLGALLDHELLGRHKVLEVRALAQVFRVGRAEDFVVCEVHRFHPFERAQAVLIRAFDLVAHREAVARASTKSERLPAGFTRIGTECLQFRRFHAVQLRFPRERVESLDRRFRQLTEAHLVEHVDETCIRWTSSACAPSDQKEGVCGGRTSILLTEDLRQVDRVVDGLLPSCRLERERGVRALRDGRELEKVARHDQLSEGRRERSERELEAG